MYEDFARRGETGACFLRITPDQTLSTYMVGQALWELMRRMETGIERVPVPARSCRALGPGRRMALVAPHLPRRLMPR